MLGKIFAWRKSSTGSQNEKGGLPEEAPTPQPEHEEEKLTDPDVTELSKRDYLAVIKRACKEALADNVTALAASLAYYSFLAVPSILLVLAGGYGMIADPVDVIDTVRSMRGVVPRDVLDLVRESLTRMSADDSKSFVVFLFGLLLAVWGLSGAMQNVMWALNQAYERKETRGFVKKRLAALVMLAFAALGFLLSFGVLALGPIISDLLGRALGAERLIGLLWMIFQWPLLIAGLLVVFAGIFYFGPNIEHPRWSFLTPGAVLTVVIWLAASGLFALYVTLSGSYGKGWGPLSAVVVMMTWLWLSNLALLLGAEVNAELERSRELRQGKDAAVELQRAAIDRAHEAAVEFDAADIQLVVRAEGDAGRIDQPARGEDQRHRDDHRRVNFATG